MLLIICTLVTAHRCMGNGYKQPKYPFFSQFLLWALFLHERSHILFVTFLCLNSFLNVCSFELCFSSFKCEHFITMLACDSMFVSWVRDVLENSVPIWVPEFYQGEISLTITWIFSKDFSKFSSGKKVRKRFWKCHALANLRNQFSIFLKTWQTFYGPECQSELYD